MTIREIINKLEAEKLQYQEENKRLNEELKKLTSEKNRIEKELNSLKKLTDDLNGKKSLVDDLKVEEVVEPVEDKSWLDDVEEEPKSKKSRKKKVEPIE